MCGHAIIALTRTVIEAGVAPKVEPLTSLKIDVPCGQISAYVELKRGRDTRYLF